ncbi:hypothetical protein [Nocardia brasiliensis]|uniref:hypothetical protein n=1 Tax=Nocardia brasiliensis TaxID=37326 RepID=UPI002456F40D|nr:hypothetical protein [Nocardia brasiliensis]
MTTKKIALYGATGITGGYALAQLHRRGYTPILVGRNAARIHRAADAADLPDAEIRLAEGTAKPGALAPAEAFNAVEFLDALVPFGITWHIEER